MMTPRTGLLVSSLIATIPILLAAQDTAPRETVQNHVSVIDMTGRGVQPDMAVLIRGDRIAAVERAAGFNRPGAQIIDLTGKFLMPGLVDMHNHLERGESIPGPPILRAGADGLVHSVTDAPLDDEFITLMKKNGATYTTTLSLYTAFSDVAAWMRSLAAMDTRGRGPEDVYARYQSPEVAKAYHTVAGTFPPENLRYATGNVRRAVDAGIPVLPGSDTGVPGVLLGISSQMELVLLVDSGLTTAEALASATINPARTLGRGREQGTIERGKLADLLVLDADPLNDIRNISKIHLVIKGGLANN